MLEFLSIRDFAIIDEVDLPFEPGLTVLTGETGAGKSIIVDALQVVLGEKVDTSVVRTGATSARVEAAFSAGNCRLPEGLDILEEQVIMTREVRREGRGRATVNGSMVTIPILRELGDGMVDLHGQHEHQSLLKTAHHLDALDAFAGSWPQRHEVADVFDELSGIRRQIQNLEKGSRERHARKDYLRFVVAELTGADLSSGEEITLMEEERILGSAEKLLHNASDALESLYQGEGSAADRTRTAAGSLGALVATDARLREIVELVEAAGTQIEEAAYLLRDYTSRVQTDPHRLEEIGDRLALLQNLKKKYGPTLEKVMETLAESRRELDQMEEGQFNMEELQEREKSLEEQASDQAGKLSVKRVGAAGDLEKRVETELADLAMEKVRFSVVFDEIEMGQTGIDDVEFLISSNPGEPLMPLRKIASGGELSRIMLALKRILAGAGAVPTLVFDEVDAGIGGKVAAILGRKLREISAHHQVLCITHLAPVAACADQHIKVEKIQDQGRTVVRARYLGEEERVAELARMMGGIEVTSGIERSARELLEEARG
ncbi:MAG: DNA repair protein RecN [bacterium]|nr:DNA repair protein RecN [bacterium]MDT8395864.1 DNA repair protein RecN [bacterium]